MSETAGQDGSWRDPSTGLTLRYRSWRPSPVRAALIILHGFGEHGGRYQAFASSLASQGIWVAAPDLPGHGRSGGKRGDLASMAGCVQQLRTMTQEMFLPASGLTRYSLFGHSFGGLLAIVWAMQNPANLQRLILESPLLDVGFPIPWWKTTAARLFTGWWPTATFSTSLDVDALSHDPAVVQGYRADPLVHHVMSARTYVAILAAKDLALEGTAAIRRPVFMLTGGEDRIVSVAVARRWFDRLSGEKQQVAFPGAYHELHHEPAREEVIRLVADWVLGAGQGAG